MKPQTHFFHPFCRVKQSTLVLTVWLALCLATPLFAEGQYLAPGHPDGIALLPPPPVPGSAEAAADLAMCRAAFKARTPAETARAEKDARLSFDLFQPAIGKYFDLEKLPKTAALLKEVKKEIAEPINVSKRHWNRLRPYQVDAQLNLGQPEPSASYPSGHSSCGTVYSLVLAEIFPDKREAILEIGHNLGWDRVLIGKHFYTDVQAGRVLGQAIVNELLASPAFQRDLAAAKAEAQKAAALAAK